MSHGQFIIALTLLVLAGGIALYFGIRWVNRSTDDPIEHGDGEP